MTGRPRRALVGVAIAAGLGAAAPPRDAFSLAILRRDGAAIPFATFNGRTWRDTWPPAQINLTVPINLGSVPRDWWGPIGPHDAWDLWHAGAAVPLRVTQPDWVAVHCARRIALRTDYRGDVIPPDTEQPYPKDGVAVYPPHRIEPIEVVSEDAPAARAVKAVLADGFNRAERETESHFSHPVGKRQREGIEPAIEAIYAFGELPQFLYVEAARSYPGGSADECKAFAFATGWFVRDGDTVRQLLMAVDVLRCDRVGGSYMLPLGVIRTGGRTFWIAQFSGWHHERYVVIELKPKMVELMITTWGGGC